MEDKDELMGYVAEEIQHSINNLREAQRKRIVLSLSTVLPGSRKGRFVDHDHFCSRSPANGMRAWEPECSHLRDVFLQHNDRVSLLLMTEWDSSSGAMSFELHIILP